MNTLSSLVSFAVVSLQLAMANAAEPPVVRVQVDATAAGNAVARTMYGLFFEDINYAADGGLYAELVQNRSFEHQDKLYAWSEVARTGAEGRFSVATQEALNSSNPTYLRMNVVRPGGGYGVVNSGFDGIALKAGEVYRLAVHIRSERPGMVMAVALLGEDGSELARAKLEDIGTSWMRRDLELVSIKTDAKASLALFAVEAGRVDIDMVSLFPAKTFKGRRNGLRADLAQTLADMKPGFLRFPGGCIVEGNGLSNAYRWKDTLGDIASRRQNWNLWKNQKSPEYNQTYGLGFFEYFQFAEDIGAEPVPVVNCGMSCQARKGGPCSPEELGQWVQDALDLVEFANGPAESKWGAVRVAMGHPAPFHLKILAVGNEQWSQSYFDHYEVFNHALKARYPDLRIISSSGPFVDDQHWNFAWEKFKSGTPADIVDEHYYVAPDWLQGNSDRYSNYDRKGPKVFVGEFAAHDRGRRSTQRAAVAEAAYMTGLLRNADVVVMAAYAPLLAKMGHVQWEPNLVWFDNSRVLRTASYHVQAIYGQNRPDTVLSSRVLASKIQTVATNGGRIGVGTWNTSAEFKEITVTTADGRTLYRSDLANTVAGWDFARGSWTATDGVLRQTDETTDRVAYLGEEKWHDYTLRLKARKLSGQEGFMIYFGAGESGSGHWNLGGWGNKQHGLDVPGLESKKVNGAIQTGRWYDIRIELRGAEIKAYLDEKLIQSATLAGTNREALYAAVGRDEKHREVVFFVANPSSQPVAARFEFGEKTPLADGKHDARWTVLSALPDAVNTFEAPESIEPRVEAVSVRVESGAFIQMIPANTFGVLRMGITR